MVFTYLRHIRAWPAGWMIFVALVRGVWPVMRPFYQLFYLPFWRCSPRALGAHRRRQRAAPGI